MTNCVTGVSTLVLRQPVARKPSRVTNFRPANAVISRNLDWVVWVMNSIIYTPTYFKNCSGVDELCLISFRDFVI